jgi:hypothetical protein
MSHLWVYTTFKPKAEGQTCIKTAASRFILQQIQISLCYRTITRCICPPPSLSLPLFLSPEKYQALSKVVNNRFDCEYFDVHLSRFPTRDLCLVTYNVKYMSSFLTYFYPVWYEQHNLMPHWMKILSNFFRWSKCIAKCVGLQL